VRESKNFWLFAASMLVAHTNAWADAGTVQLRQEAADLVITVFTSPAPLCVGPVDLSLLLQNRSGLEPVLDANVRVVLREDASGIEFQARLTRAQARNKLLYAAPVMFARAGKWKMAVTIERNGKQAEAGGILDVAPAPGKLSYAGYIAFPPIMIALFVIRERLIRARSRR
jgi:hypothetical protein